MLRAKQIYFSKSNFYSIVTRFSVFKSCLAKTRANAPIFYRPMYKQIFNRQVWSVIRRFTNPHCVPVWKTTQHRKVSNQNFKSSLTSHLFLCGWSRLHLLSNTKQFLTDKLVSLHRQHQHILHSHNPTHISYPLQHGQVSSCVYFPSP